MTRFKKLYGPILAPWITLAGRATGSATMLGRAAELDSLSFRSQLLHAAATGQLTGEPSRLLMAAKLVLACKQADKIVVEKLARSNGQLLQDIVALLASNVKQNGYFVEVGVGDGINHSNSLLLENDYGWNGVLVEPNRDSHDSIRAKRKAKLVTQAAYSRGGESVGFTSMQGVGELSGIRGHLDASRVTSDTQTYEVSTETLDTILATASAPQNIDFMSIDTEGSEMEVLKGLSLDRWKVDFFAIEHNHQHGKLNALRQHLEPAGYRQIFAHISEFDAWFIHRRANSSYFD
jgi:FkbM family methyltransferase